MATKAQIHFISRHRDKIKPPILIIGSKMYDYDQESIRVNLEKWGFTEIIGVDIERGKEVDIVQDITDGKADFFNKYNLHFGTVFCMEVLTNVNNPFKAAENVEKVLQQGGNLFLSEAFVRKMSRMPADYWRFTFDGFKALFFNFKFEESNANISLMRNKSGVLLPFSHNMPEILHERHADEMLIGFLLRKIHRKFFSTGVFSLSRYLPESTVYAVGQKE